MNKKAFTLIELLVVVLIIAILAAIALPKYQVARDRAHLSGLMTIGKNVNDALDRRSLFDSTEDGTALDLIDISFKDYTGSDCTGGYCRIDVSGKDYDLFPGLNDGGTEGYNRTRLMSYDNSALGALYVYVERHSNSFIYYMYCYQMGGSYVDPDTERCVRVGKSLGATNSQCDDSNATAYCAWS